jgi:hypothetical protein
MAEPIAVLFTPDAVDRHRVQVLLAETGEQMIRRADAPSVVDIVTLVERRPRHDALTELTKQDRSAPDP